MAQLEIQNRVFWLVFLFIQLVFFALFFTVCDYDYTSQNADWSYLKDVSVMIVVGFGFLMTFLKKYGFGALGFTLLSATFCVECTILFKGLFDVIESENWTRIPIGVDAILQGMFGAAAVLITFGGVLGKVSPAELLFVALIETFFYAVNLYVSEYQIGGIDVGGSIFIHTFGAYFGLSLTMMVSPRHEPETYELMDSRYTSDQLAMIGTLFLWVYWPSFNASAALSTNRELVVTNTLLSIGSSTLAAFTGSRLLSLKGRYFSMVDIQNATLAGGVAVGAVSNFQIGPGGALVVGFVAGWVSVIGYHYIQPALASKIELQDTCGIHNLHGMPGLIGAAASMLMCGITSSENVDATLLNGNSGLAQMGYQAASTATTLAIAIVSALGTGLLIMGVRRFAPFVLNSNSGEESDEADMEKGTDKKKNVLFADEIWWEVPGDYEDEQASSNIQASERTVLLDRRSTFKRT